ncbi:Rhs-family protein [Salmonella enterica subsp. enterica]|uniref:Rhs-family protein n=1 Tax=Salmonella enterica I TaxID=59201 RepID=A0A379WE52_SALET|nr:Rhs-family protein [Salmonella enterica subsp. enterica]
MISILRSHVHCWQTRWQNPRETGHATYEHYEWPENYFDKSEGEMLTRIRMEAQRSPGSRVLGGGNIRTLMTGYTFTLENYPTAEVNQEYLLMQTLLFVQDNAAAQRAGPALYLFHPF